MTPNEINQAIHETCGFNKLVGLKKLGLWYRPNACGYTDREDEAGRYTLEEAKRHGSVHGEYDDVTICEFKPANYYGDLNEMHKAEGFIVAMSIAHPTTWSRYCDHLAEICESLHQAIHAKSEQRAKAFMVWCDKWRD